MCTVCTADPTGFRSQTRSVADSDTGYINQVVSAMKMAAFISQHQQQTSEQGDQQQQQQSEQ
jgi:hypothetical protein